MGRNIIPVTFLVLLTLMSCSTNPLEPEQNYVPGEVLVNFESGTTEAAAKVLILDLELEWKEYFEHLGVALLGVPVGQEHYWIAELEQQTLVASAQFNHTDING